MMGGLLAGLTGLLIVGGLGLIVAGLRPSPDRLSTARSTPVWTRVRRWWATLPRCWRAWVGIGSVAGLVSYAMTGWVLAVVLVPAGLFGIPWLLADPPNREIDLLAALDRWVRALASSLPTGKSIRDAIRVTRGQVPDLLQRPVALLLARLDDRWSIRDAFFTMADELDSPDADAVLTALALAAERGGTGAAATLNALSDSIHDRLRAAREIETERAKPRIVVRHVTIISATMLGGALLFGGQFFAPYRSGIGTVILMVLLGAYVGSLLMLRRMARPAARERLLVWRTGADGV